MRAGNWIFCSGVEATDFKQATAPDARIDPRSPGAGWNAEVVAQTKYIYNNFMAIAEEVGIDFDARVARIYQWFHVDNMVDAWANIRIDPYLETRNIWLTHNRPASSALAIAE